MSVTIANSTTLIRPNIAPGITDLRGRPTDLLDWFERRGSVIPNAGGAPYRWSMLPTSTGVAEVYVEGQALGAIGQPTYQQASILATYHRSAVQNTGHVRDQIRLGGYVADADPVAAAIASATQDLRVLVDANLAGSTTDLGIAAIVDAAGIYAGIDAGVVVQWSSLETGPAGALSIDLLRALYLELTNAPRAAMPTDVLCNTNQYDRYLALFSFQNAAVARTNPLVERGPYDLGMRDSQPAYNGVPFTPVRSLTNTELYMLDAGQGIMLREQRPVQTEMLRLAPDQETMVVSQALAPVFTNRRQQGKLTGLTV